MPTSATETVVISSVQRSGLVARQGAQSLALIAPMPSSLPGGSTVVANTVYEYNDPQTAEGDWGAATDIAVGVEAALQHLAKVKVIGVAAATGSPFTFTTGTSTAVDQSDDVGTTPITAANMPLTTITSVTVDGVVISAANIILTGSSPLTLTVAAGKIAINPYTGAWKLGTATSGAGAGLVVVYAAHDWNTALENLNKEAFEYVTAPNKAYSGANYGIFKRLHVFADLENKLVAACLPSAAVPEVRATDGVNDILSLTIRAVRDGRIKLFAPKAYSGDGTSSFAAWQAAMDPAGTSKEQVAPANLTITDGYAFAEFGGERTPSTGTWHEMGVNAVYKSAGGAYLVTNDRASTLLTDFNRFHSSKRVVRIIENEVQEDLLTLRRASPTAIPFDETGLTAIRETIRATLERQKTKGYITEYTVFVPAYATIPTENLELRVVEGVSYGVRLRGQVHMLEITQEVSL